MNGHRSSVVLLYFEEPARARQKHTRMERAEHEIIRARVQSADAVCVVFAITADYDVWLLRRIFVDAESSAKVRRGSVFDLLVDDDHVDI